MLGTMEQAAEEWGVIHGQRRVRRADGARRPEPNLLAPAAWGVRRWQAVGVNHDGGIDAVSDYAKVADRL